MLVVSNRIEHSHEDGLFLHYLHHHRHMAKVAIAVTRSDGLLRVCFVCVTHHHFFDATSFINLSDHADQGRLMQLGN